MNLKTLQQIADAHGVSVHTLHTRRRALGLEGTKIGNARVFTPAQVRKLLKEGKRGRPRKAKR